MPERVRQLTLVDIKGRSIVHEIDEKSRLKSAEKIKDLTEKKGKDKPVGTGVFTQEEIEELNGKDYEPDNWWQK